MNGLAIIRELESRGIKVALSPSGKLIIDAPRGALAPAEIERLREFKPAIVGALAVREKQAASREQEADVDQRIPCAIAAEIRAIEPEAYRLGWIRQRLWDRDFWPHTPEQQRGLASLLEPGDSISEITHEYLVITRRMPSALNGFLRYRFWRNDA